MSRGVIIAAISIIDAKWLSVHAHRRVVSRHNPTRNIAGNHEKAADAFLILRVHVYRYQWKENKQKGFHAFQRFIGITHTTLKPIEYRHHPGMDPIKTGHSVSGMTALP